MVDYKFFPGVLELVASVAQWLERRHVRPESGHWLPGCGFESRRGRNFFLPSLFMFVLSFQCIPVWGSLYYNLYSLFLPLVSLCDPGCYRWFTSVWVWLYFHFLYHYFQTLESFKILKWTCYCDAFSIQFPFVVQSTKIVTVRDGWL